MAARLGRLARGEAGPVRLAKGLFDRLRGLVRLGHRQNPSGNNISQR